MVFSVWVKALRFGASKRETERERERILLRNLTAMQSDGKRESFFNFNFEEHKN